MDKQIKARLTWVNLYLQTEDAGYVCRKCGISRPTLRKWHRRYLAQGLEGLNDQSKKPHSSPNQKLTQDRIKLILALRKERNLGARRIQTELLRLHDCSLSLASIHKALTTQQAQPIKKLRCKKKFKRYSRPIPGDRIQMDTCKIAPGIYQYTAVDDCSRWRVLEIYKRRTANNTLHFLDLVLEQFPFPIQRIQTDRGLEFFAEKVQLKLMELGIKFRPNKPGSPHLNGKVERSQKTDLEEFYAITDLSNFENLREELLYVVLLLSVLTSITAALAAAILPAMMPAIMRPINNKLIACMSTAKTDNKYPTNAPNNEIIMTFLRPHLSDKSPRIGDAKKVVIKKMDDVKPNKKYRIRGLMLEDNILSGELTNSIGNMGPSKVPLNVSIKITTNNGIMRERLFVIFINATFRFKLKKIKSNDAVVATLCDTHNTVLCWMS